MRLTHPSPVAIVLAALTASGAAAADPSFCDPAQESVGSFPTGVTVHDLTADGFPEVIISNSQSTFISILPNLGGTLGPASDYEVGSGRPRAAAVADLDGDGDEDVVVAVRKGSGSIVVLLNLGGGVFAPPASYGPPSAGFALALVDLDADGDRDVVTLASTILVGDVVVLENLGDGTFTGGVAYEAVETDIIYAADLAAADVDGDGHPDIVVTSDCPIACGPHTVVLPGDGAGGLAAPVPFDVGLEQSTGVVAADLDADGDVDLAVVDCTFPNQALAIALNDGSGGYTAGPRYVVNDVCHSFTTPAAIAAGDVNFDGIPDIVLGAHRADAVFVFVNRGDATFEAPVPFATAAEPMSVTIADVDADGRPDIVTASLDEIGTPGTATVLRNRAGAPADVNGDGVVSLQDLLSVLAAWGPCPECPEDTNEDGVVDLLDLLSVLGSWGECP